MTTMKFHKNHEIAWISWQINGILCMHIYRGLLDPMPSFKDSKCPSIGGLSDAPESFITCKLRKLKMKESNLAHRLKITIERVFNDLREMQWP